MKTENRLDIIDSEILCKELENMYYYRWRTIDSLIYTSGYTNDQIRYLFDTYMSDKIIQTSIKNVDGKLYLYSTRKYYDETHNFFERLITAITGKFIV